MGWESSGEVGFDLGPLLHGQMRTAKLKSSAGRSLGFFLSMFVSDICNQTSNISDYGVEV